MKALISKIETRETGWRIAQVEQDENTFAVAEGMEWVDCADDVVADLYWFDPQDNTIKLIPANQPNQAQPIVEGAQTL